MPRFCWHLEYLFYTPKEKTIKIIVANPKRERGLCNFVEVRNVFV
jgi:hypothetical protein